MARKTQAKKAGPPKKAPRAKSKPRVKRRTSRSKAPAGPLDEQAMMTLWQKTLTPAAGHRRLDPLVGSFKTKTTFIFTPGAPPQVSTGTSEQRWQLGGRYLEQRYKGTSMGLPFEGLGFTAYDNAQGKYVGTWMDTFGTGLMDSVGVGRPSHSKIDFESSSVDPSGERVKFQCTIRIQDKNHHSYEMWARADNGRRFRLILVEYTRK